MFTSGVLDIGADKMTIRKERLIPSERTIESISTVEVLYEEFGITGREENGEVILDPGFTMPARKLIEEARKRYFEKVKNSKYREERFAHYPTIANQLDMIYHDIKAGNLATGKWVTAIDEIKRTFPKPES